MQILVVTTLGGVCFAAMDALGGYTIWNSFLFHASINAAWAVFAVSDTAASGWGENVLRIVSAILAIRLLRFVGKGPQRDASPHHVQHENAPGLFKGSDGTHLPQQPLR